MTNIVIINNKGFGHLEIIESIINKYSEIIGFQPPILETTIFLFLRNDVDKSFLEYINLKYPKIKTGLPKKIDFSIDVNFYPKPENLKRLDIIDRKRHFYISHRVFESRDKYPNVFFLTPLSLRNFLYTDILPFMENKKIPTDIPIYVIQGNFSEIRRDYNLLKVILKHDFKYDYRVKLVGRGDIPKVVLSFPEKFIICQNKTFIDFHKEFQDCYCIMTLVTRKRHKKYYKSSLTSTINYARGYNLRCLIDRQLQDIYNLSNAQVYNKPRDIVHAFERTLKYFYSKKEKRLKEEQNTKESEELVII